MVTTDIAADARDQGDIDRTDRAGGEDTEAGSTQVGDAAGWETVASLPASAKLVARTLEYEGPQTGTDLASATRLPSRTVRYAVDRLEEAGVVAVRPSLQDAREKQYRLRID
jgi:DNA-binding transcriptional ArsR family regulator